MKDTGFSFRFFCPPASKPFSANLPPPPGLSSLQRDPTPFAFSDAYAPG